MRTFFEYFIIRKVASGESFMKSAVRVLRKFTNWLLENDHIDKPHHTGLIEYFSKGKSKALSNAEKVGDLIYEQTRREQNRKYEKELEGYFTILDIRDGELWLNDMMGKGADIGPVKVTKSISELCEEGWDLSLLIGKFKDKWYIIESGNVYPTN